MKKKLAFVAIIVLACGVLLWAQTVSGTLRVTCAVPGGGNNKSSLSHNFVVPQDKEATAFTISSIEFGRDCLSGAVELPTTAGIYKWPGRREVYRFVQQKGQRPVESLGPLSKLRLPPGSYEIAILGGGLRRTDKTGPAAFAYSYRIQ